MWTLALFGLVGLWIVVRDRTAAPSASRASPASPASRATPSASVALEAPKALPMLAPPTPSASVALGAPGTGGAASLGGVVPTGGLISPTADASGFGASAPSTAPGSLGALEVQASSAAAYSAGMFAARIAPMDLSRPPPPPPPELFIARTDVTYAERKMDRMGILTSPLPFLISSGEK